MICNRVYLTPSEVSKLRALQREYDQLTKWAVVALKLGGRSSQEFIEAEDAMRRARAMIQDAIQHIEFDNPM